jgi:acylphosphatase
MSSNRDQSPLHARRFLVRGRVQGVGFRWFVEREAHILGVAGWVRNNADGAVEVFAQGTRDQLSGLRSRLQQGPRAARVDAVEESDVPLTQGLKTFRIEGAW